MITIKVPATSANLGAGFDCLGMAVSLYNIYTFGKSNQLEITGCPSEFANENNMVYSAYAKAFEVCGKIPVPVHIHLDCAIPISRGLGSSAACIVAGVIAADYFMGEYLSEDEIFKLCSDIEGHPDNVAPALFGGIQACFIEEDQVYHNRYSLHDSYHLTVLIPPFPLSTSKARSVLPKAIERKDAVYNISHAIATLRYLENGDYDKLSLALRDCLHQSYRFPLIQGADKMIELCKSVEGSVVYLSGAGPTLLCISKEEIAHKLSNKNNLGWTIQEVTMVQEGALKGVKENV